MDTKRKPMAVDRTQPPRMKGLQWHDTKPMTEAEKVLMGIGWSVAAGGILILVWSFF